jgi:hypothetical protein
MGSEGDLWAATPVRRAQLVKVLLDIDYEVYLTVKTTFARNTTGLPQRSRTQEYEPEVSIVQMSHALTQTQCRDLADALVNGGGYVSIDRDTHTNASTEGAVRDARGRDTMNKHKSEYVRSAGAHVAQGGKKLKETSYTIDNTFIDPLIRLAPDGAGPLRFQAWNGQTVILALNNQTYSPPSTEGSRRCGREADVQKVCGIVSESEPHASFEKEAGVVSESEPHDNVEKVRGIVSESESHAKEGKAGKGHAYGGAFGGDEPPPQPRMNEDQWWSLCCDQVCFCVCVGVCVCMFVCVCVCMYVCLW